jgi:hypothetical protein
MQLSTRWLQYLQSLPKNRLGKHDVVVFYQDGDKQKIAKGMIWTDGTLETTLPITFSERQITNIKTEFSV